MITNAMSISLAYHFFEKLLCSALPFYPPSPTPLPPPPIPPPVKLAREPIIPVA